MLCTYEATCLIYNFIRGTINAIIPFMKINLNIIIMNYDIISNLTFILMFSQI